MNLKDLYYFYDLSNLQSFTDVARKHEVSQPSISYAIKRLEKDFHCQLIMHDPFLCYESPVPMPPAIRFSCLHRLNRPL